MKTKPHLRPVNPSKKIKSVERKAENKARRLSKSPLQMPMQEAMRKFKGMS